MRLLKVGEERLVLVRGIVIGKLMPESGKDSREEIEVVEILVLDVEVRVFTSKVKLKEDSFVFTLVAIGSKI